MRRLIPALALLLLALAPPVEAQSRSSFSSPGTDRSGVWVSTGLGWGSVMPSCPICARERSGGLSGYLRVGGSVTRNVLVGVEGNGWYKGGEDVDQLVGSASVVTLLYPRSDMGLYVKVGLGLTRYEARPTDDDPTAATNTVGVNLGVGYELRALPAVSLVPYLNVVAGSFGSLREDDDTLTGDMNVSLVQLGLGVTLH